MFHIKMLINERLKLFSGGTPLMATADVVEIVIYSYKKVQDGSSRHMEVGVVSV